MTPEREFIALAERAEAVKGTDRTGLRNAIAVAIGWHRVEPRFTKSRHGAWIKPDDFIGVHSDGSPKFDSLHGTDMHREPPNFLESTDAAMTVIPSGWTFANLSQSDRKGWWCELRKGFLTSYDKVAFGNQLENTNAAVAITAAALRARAAA